MQTSKSTGLCLLLRTSRLSGSKMESKTPLLMQRRRLSNANHANFIDFDSVKDAYVEFKHTENPTNDPRTRKVASVTQNGHGGGSFPCKQDRGQGLQTSDKCQKGLVPQAKVDKQTHIFDRHYSDTKFYRLTPAEKQKLWQLRNIGKTPGTGPTQCDRRRAVALTSTSSTSSGSSVKCQVEDPPFKSNQPEDDQKWGRNRNNPALGRQVTLVVRTTDVPSLHI
jgi:hypothetical protein